MQVWGLRRWSLLHLSEHGVEASLTERKHQSPQSQTDNADLRQILNYRVLKKPGPEINAINQKQFHQIGKSMMRLMFDL